MNFLSLLLNNKRLIRNGLKKTVLRWGPWRKFLKELQTGPQGTIHLSASSEVLPGPRTWKASRANGEANRGVGAAWTRLEGAGHGGRGSESLAGGGAACSWRILVIFGSGRTCERAGRYG
jgi:hypothetical protein